MIQAMGLKKRLVHTHSRTAVVGISGGLDSTLALLVTAKAFDMAGKDRKDIICLLYTSHEGIVEVAFEQRTEREFLK